MIPRRRRSGSSGISVIVPVEGALSIWESGGVAASPPLPPAGPTYFTTVLMMALAPAPVMRSSVWPCVRRGEGEPAWGGEAGPTRRKESGRLLPAVTARTTAQTRGIARGGDAAYLDSPLSASREYHPQKRTEGQRSVSTCQRPERSSKPRSLSPGLRFGVRNDPNSSPSVEDLRVREGDSSGLIKKWKYRGTIVLTRRPAPMEHVPNPCSSASSSSILASSQIPVAQDPDGETPCKFKWNAEESPLCALAKPHLVERFLDAVDGESWRKQVRVIFGRGIRDEDVLVPAHQPFVPKTRFDAEFGALGITILNTAQQQDLKTYPSRTSRIR
ncbi:hypothetical protein EDB86DRAFT_2832742 [Lactarius hatsudake]|nr:hypothetical protein EDB86DRAFT_2832742 [Lactarius hatsudake]